MMNVGVEVEGQSQQLSTETKNTLPPPQLPQPKDPNTPTTLPPPQLPQPKDPKTPTTETLTKCSMDENLVGSSH